MYALTNTHGIVYYKTRKAQKNLFDRPLLFSSYYQFGEIIYKMSNTLSIQTICIQQKGQNCLEIYIN